MIEFINGGCLLLDSSDEVQTNGVENFWSLLKCALKGTYVNVEPFHFFQYCDEQAFRFNERKDTDQGRFVKALQGIVGMSLRYAKLIAAEGGDGPHPSMLFWELLWVIINFHWLGQIGVGVCAAILVTPT